LDVLREVDPATFSHQRYLAIPELLDPALCSFFWSSAHTKFASRLLRGDAQVAMTPSDYGDPAFDGLLEYLRPRVQDHSGLRLLPTYSYFRIYKRGDVLHRHRDRPACEISVTVNIGQKPLDPRPIYVQGEGEPRAADLRPGDGSYTAERSYSIGATPTAERRWCRCFSTMSTGTARMPSKNSMAAHR
jgi:hypothetical protein